MEFPELCWVFRALYSSHNHMGHLHSGLTPSVYTSQYLASSVSPGLHEGGCGAQLNGFWFMEDHRRERLFTKS